MREPVAELLEGYERELLRPAVRRSPERLRELLHAEFREFGASGRVWTLSEILEELASETPGHLLLDEVRARRVGEEAWLLTYRSRREGPEGTRESLRSSLWVRVDDRWQMLFHQGTVVP